MQDQRVRIYCSLLFSIMCDLPPIFAPHAAHLAIVIGSLSKVVVDIRGISFL